MRGKAIPTGLILVALTFLIIFRTQITLYPELDKTVCEPQDTLFEYLACHGEIKSSDIVCVVIWLLVTFITTSLVWDIIRKGLGRSAFKDFHKIISLLSIISYEAWMFGYIYKTYVTNFDWSFTFIIFLPLVTLLVHSIFQTFLSYDECVPPIDKEKTKDLVYYILTSLGFNFVMMVDVISMFITALSTGVSTEKNFIYVVNIGFLGITEMMYRAYVMYNHFKQLKKHYLPYNIQRRIMDINNINMYGRAEMVSHRASPDGELVTGKTQDRGDILYLTAQIAATVTVVVVGTFVAGKI